MVTDYGGANVAANLRRHAGSGLRGSHQLGKIPIRPFPTRIHLQDIRSLERCCRKSRNLRIAPSIPMASKGWIVGCLVIHHAVSKLLSIRCPTKETNKFCKRIARQYSRMAAVQCFCVANVCALNVLTLFFVDEK